MLSYWEKKELERRFDLLVIGGGITGYSAAIEYKAYRPDLRVGVVERSAMETTASTKNAGFACIGSVTEMMSDLRKLGEEQFVALVNQRWKGLRILRQRIGDQAMAYNECGGYEVYRSQLELEAALIAIKELNPLLRHVVGTEVFHHEPHMGHFGFEAVLGLSVNRYEGQLDPGLMMASLKDVARVAGIIPVQAEVLEIDSGSTEVKLRINEGTLHASQVIVAVNGLASRLLDLEVKPARAQVLLTSPIDELGWSGVFHADEGYYYFRNVGERVLLGGARNADFEAEETFDQTTTTPIQDKLENMLRQQILPGRKFEIEHRWAGTMGVGPSKSPIVKHVDDRLIAAVRMGGMGVAIGSLVGKQAAGLAL